MTVESGDFIDPDDFQAALDALQAQIDGLTSNNPRCRVAKSGTQVVTINTGTALTFNVESWDVGPCHSGSSSQLIAPIDGIYEGLGYMSWESDTRGFRTITVRANGSTDVSALKVEAEGSGPTLQAIPWEIFLSAGDYVQLLGYYEASGGDPSTLDILGASFTMRWVGSPT